MKKLFCLIILTFSCLFLVSKGFAQCQGNVYITSLTWQTANSVQSYSSTELDYCSGLYYDPVVSGSLIEGYGNGYAVLGQGYTQGFADSVPARLDFGYAAPINNLSYATNGDHYVIAYYQVYVPFWNDYYWYDPWSLGFSGDPGWGFYAPDYFGYWSYVSYWVSTPQYVGNTSHAITYTGQTQCLPGQQFTSTGQPCSSIPQCQPGQQFTTTGELCPNYQPPPDPPAQPNVTVHVANNPLRPKGTSGTRNSSVFTCITGVQNPVGLPVKLELVLDTSNPLYDGGHKASYHTGSRPLGTLGKSVGVTGQDGCYSTTYSPPHISGVFQLKSTISGITNYTHLGVWFPDLLQLHSGDNYTLIGSTASHPDNHYATWQARDGLIQIANDYAAEFYGGAPPENQKIAYNDISLILGGKFDLSANWSNAGSHAEHREGINCDTRSNNIPAPRHNRLMQIFRNRGSTRTNDERHTAAPHWHLRFEFNFATVQNPASQMQNGIEQNFRAFMEYNDVPHTPSSLTTDIGDAILGRQVTQEEFETWYPLLTNAKVQGSNVFLQEVQTFERQLFNSPEYRGRSRTDEEFIQDVFASHLFREPTSSELTHWLGILSSFGQPAPTPFPNPYDPPNPERERGYTNNPQNQALQRQQFLNTFQNLPDFINLIAGVIDDTY